MKIRPVGAELFHSGERTIMTKLVVAFRNFVKVPKKQLHSHPNTVKSSKTCRPSLGLSKPPFQWIPQFPPAAGGKGCKGRGVKVTTVAQFFVSGLGQTSRVCLDWATVVGQPQSIRDAADVCTALVRISIYIFRQMSTYKDHCICCNLFKISQINVWYYGNFVLN
jgi:hypothetical protein